MNKEEFDEASTANEEEFDEASTANKEEFDEAPAANEEEFDEAPTESDGRTLTPAEEGDTVKPAEEGDAVAPPERLLSIVESLLFATDRPLSPAQIKALVGERDTQVIAEALQQLREHYTARGVHVVEVAGGWQMRTASENAAWVQKLLGGRPVRLTRAQLETLSIIAYRQPITRPEIDEIRGVDCGATLKLLLDRNLIRILGKKEEPGRPLLYGTTKEFLEFFNLNDLRDLPTLREFHELTEEHRAKVEALEEEQPSLEVVAPERPAAVELPAIDPSEEEDLLGGLAAAEHAAESASAPFRQPKKEDTPVPTADGAPPPAKE
jgi:segregation and condensation protein B